MNVDASEGPILVAIGSNLPAPGLGSPLETCRAAVRALAALPGLRLVQSSRWYRSAAMPRSEQPPYVNGVVRLAGSADPATLLCNLHEIEAAAGRTRGLPNAARTLDLDLIAIGSTVRGRPDPILPHPRLHLRAFVLRPLGDVAPGWVHPASGLTARAMLAGLAAQEIEPL